MDIERVRHWVEILQKVADRKRALKEVEDNAKAAIQEEMGDAPSGELDGKTVVTWKAHKRKALDQAALKAAEPEIAELYSKTTEVRRFEIVDE